MTHRDVRILLAALPLLLVACGDGEDASSADNAGDRTTNAGDPPSVSVAPSGSVFPTAGFAALSDAPASDEAAARFQEVLVESAGSRGVTATVMTADGTWSGAVGTADGETAMEPDAQMAIGSVTKTTVAAQVMRLVESGDVVLDDPIADYLPDDLGFDTNEATVRQVLSMRSGIPEYTGEELVAGLSEDRQHQWTIAELLALVSPDRAPPGEGYEYSNTNYLLVHGLIEHVTGRPLADVLRDGVLAGDGLDRMIFQPAEAPTAPLAMPSGEPLTALEDGGGYLPSLAGATAAGGAGAIASDSASLARWWASLCSGEVVSGASLDEMTTPLVEGQEYGLGIMAADLDGRQGVSHGGLHVGFNAWAECFIDEAAVVVVLANDEDVDATVEVVTALAEVLSEGARR